MSFDMNKLVQQGVDEWGAPLLAHDLGADDDIAKLPRQSVRQRVTRVDRKCERVGRFVDAEVLRLQCTALVGADERDPQLARADSLAREHAPREIAHGGFVDVDARAVVDLDLDHLRRGSECSLYASTIRCTSLWRTTSW